MDNVYQESITDELAKTLLGEKFNEDYDYCLITDEMGTYVTGFNKETGDFLEYDDISLDVEPFEFGDEMDEGIEVKQVVDDIRYRWTMLCGIAGIISLIVCGILLLL